MVKCPQCGFFSYRGLTRCSKCGANLAPAASPTPAPTATPPAVAGGPTRHEGAAAPGSTALPSDRVQQGPGKEAPRAASSGTIDSPQSQDLNAPTPRARPRPVSENLDFEFVSERPAQSKANPAQAPDPEAWRQELSDRVSSFRQRRAQLRNEPGEEEENLDFEFGRTETSGEWEPEVERVVEFPTNAGSIDAEIAALGPVDDPRRHSDAAAAEEGDEQRFEIPDSPRTRADDFAFEPASSPENLLEIVLGPPEAGVSAAASSTELEAYAVAPMRSRCLAGLADGLVLLSAGGIFAVIFKFAGGRFTPVPLNLAVLGVIACVVVGAYFGLFTTLAFSTPGQAWLGMEVRNLDGRPPELRESLLRAFGYLVSLSAFMIGFLWALVDSDSLTWHDRISGTFLTPAKKSASQGVQSTL